MPKIKLYWFWKHWIGLSFIKGKKRWWVDIGPLGIWVEK